ncbi:hypothetical protein A6770_13680 [Nostoc minutum NIES-26]|uniref:Uncharacterized protein n=1 Tax=Nostoc minutum NIES-26 TaxID=1844469 RepID=A0A367RRC9_9NOSO|nr:hypothetical protein A6770_13680 [Nostoc minutum NIES-26]
MHIKSNLLNLGVVFATLLANSLISDSQVKGKIPLLPTQKSWIAVQSANIATLANGNYQFCSQPDPKDWRDGAGVCLNFSKVGNRLNGYYGYPHSDNFICIRGTVDNNLIAGEALAILWGVNQLKNTPESAFKWDLEQRLTLSQGHLISTANNGEDAVKRILYRHASLNLEGFYQYNRPRMTPPSQLCEWKAQK